MRPEPHCWNPRCRRCEGMEARWMIEAARAEATRENARRDAVALRASLPPLQDAWDAEPFGSEAFRSVDFALDQLLGRIAELERVATA